MFQDALVRVAITSVTYFNGKSAVWVKVRIHRSGDISDGNLNIAVSSPVSSAVNLKRSVEPGS